MDEIEKMISLPKRRNLKGSNSKKISISMPEFLLSIVDEEMKEKGRSRSQVISYLTYCGLKAHVGLFKLPGENSIMKNYLKRGKIWQMKNK
jgi:hypothetical protein